MVLGQASQLSDVSTRFLQVPRGLDGQGPFLSKQVHVTASQQMSFAFVHKIPEGWTPCWVPRTLGLGVTLVPPGTDASPPRPALSHSRLLGLLQRHDTCQSPSTATPWDQCEQCSLLCALRGRLLLAWPDALGLWPGLVKQWVSAICQPLSSLFPSLVQAVSPRQTDRYVDAGPASP